MREIWGASRPAVFFAVNKHGPKRSINTFHEEGSCERFVLHDQPVVHRPVQHVERRFRIHIGAELADLNPAARIPRFAIECLA